MRCETARSRISRYVDNELDGPELRSFEEHIGSCPACESELDAHRRLWILLGQAPSIEPPEFIESVEVRLAQRERWGAVVAKIRVETFAYAAAAAVLLGVSVWAGIWAGSVGRPPADAEHDHAMVELLQDAPAGLEGVTMLDGFGEER